MMAKVKRGEIDAIVFVGIFSLLPALGHVKTRRRLGGIPICLNLNDAEKRNVSLPGVKKRNRSIGATSII